MNDKKLDLKQIKDKIESLREDINRYIQYPDIFKEEIETTSQKIDFLINEYIRESKDH